MADGLTARAQEGPDPPPAHDRRLRLFGERGFDGTTVEAIAEAADVAPRAFFRYFPTKVDVLFADHEHLVGQLRDTLASRPPEEPVVRAVRRSTLAGVDLLSRDPALYLTRSRLVAAIPDAHARSGQLDADYEDVIAAAFAATRGTDPATDLRARVERRRRRSSHPRQRGVRPHRAGGRVAR